MTRLEKYELFFRTRFDREPQHDKYYFEEWCERLENNQLDKMDNKSIEVWNEILKKNPNYPKITQRTTESYSTQNLNLKGYLKRAIKNIDDKEKTLEILHKCVEWQKEAFELEMALKEKLYNLYKTINE